MFGKDGEWSSPGGSAKSFQNNRVHIAWYANKKSLLFQCERGDKIKDLVVNICGSKTQTNEYELKENSRLPKETSDVKTNAYQLSSVMNSPHVRTCLWLLIILNPNA